NSANDRVESVRHRSDVGRRRALARHVGRWPERAAANHSRNRRGRGDAGDAAGSPDLRPRVGRWRSVLLWRRSQREVDDGATAEVITKKIESREVIVNVTSASSEAPLVRLIH